METNTELICPYCLLDPARRGGMTDEHPFLRSLGGRSVIRVCKVCNDTIGHTIEGPSLKHDTLLNFARPACGLGGKPVRGRLPSSFDEIHYDFNAREFISPRPVVSWETEGEVRRVQMQGGPRQLRELLNGPIGTELGLTSGDIEEILASSVSLRDPEDMFSTTIKFDINLGARLAAKVALGAGILADERFALSGLAAGLRRIMNGDSEVEASVDPDAIDAFLEVVNSWPPGRTPCAPLAPIEGERISRVVFLRMGSRTAVFAYLIGILVSMSGIVVDARLDCDELGIVVSDGRPTSVRRLSWELLGPLVS